MLFSEPKIPQSQHARPVRRKRRGFSALQRAENSSILVTTALTQARALRFSALQRAENSSMTNSRPIRSAGSEFQCSSASRKFLNRSDERRARAGAGFQCSSASRKFLNSYSLRSRGDTVRVSVLFSEPKIPQSVRKDSSGYWTQCFSALQRAENSSIAPPPRLRARPASFSALQRADNSSMHAAGRHPDNSDLRFQCSSAS